MDRDLSSIHARILCFDSIVLTPSCLFGWLAEPAFQSLYWVARSVYLEGSILMVRMTPEQVESRLSTVRCAICKANSFSIDRRSMQPDGEWKAGCMKCRYSFPVHTDMEFYEQTQPDIPYHLKSIPCPKCELHGVTLDFRIVLSVREAFYFVTCKACRHSFPEKSSLESFE
jgi:hypothetical protein